MILKYAGFWRRLGAALIDVFIFIPLYPSLFSGCTHWKTLFLESLGTGLLYTFYVVYCHGRWGQTLGKKITRIRVTKLDGTRINWRIAFLRYFVDFAFTILSFVVSTATFLSITDFNSVVCGVQPDIGYVDLVSLAWIIWICSDLAVLLFNKKKRAIHDFIAHTVVIHAHVPKDSSIPSNAGTHPILGSIFVLFVGLFFGLIIWGQGESLYNTTDFEVETTIPQEIEIGQVFSMDFVFKNNTNEPIEIEEIEFDSSFFYMFSFQNVVPTPIESDELFQFRYWIFDQQLLPEETKKITFSFHPIRTGIFTGNIELCSSDLECVGINLVIQVHNEVIENP